MHLHWLKIPPLELPAAFPLFQLFPTHLPVKVALSNKLICLGSTIPWCESKVVRGAILGDSGRSD
jgi:hypothetical protein